MYRAAGVAPGLAYHYFDSKEGMFAEAIADYARRCAEGVCELLDDDELSLDERLDRALELGAAGGYPYAAFFHAEGHGALHDRLSLAMCEAVRPHLRAALALPRGLRRAGADLRHRDGGRAREAPLPARARGGGALVVGDAWQPAPARAIMNAWMPHSKEGNVRIYSEAEMRRILGTWFSDVSWRRVGQTACVAVARKGA